MAQRTYRDEQLAAAVAAAHSWRGFLRELGLKATSAGAARSVRRQAERLNLDTRHFTGQRRWREDQLRAAVASSQSWTQVATTLGLSGGASATALKGHALRLGIDSSHFGRMTRPAPSDSVLPTPDLINLPRSGSFFAVAWFSMCGYDVSWPLEPCSYDLLASSGGEFLRIQVKTTRLRHGDSWVAQLSKSRRARVVYDPDSIDYFFIVDGDLDFYLIPVSCVGGLHGITLSGYDQFRVSQNPAAAVT